MFLLMTSLIEENNIRTRAPEVSEDLILRIGKKDTEALHELYSEAKDAVYGFAYSILKNVDDAQDILQETFVKVYSSAHSYKPKGKPMAWILTITKNMALMKIRDKKKVLFIDAQDDLSHGVEEGFSSNSENKIIVEEILLNLSDEERQIVVLHAMTGVKHREIAEIMNMSLSNVLSKYNRAIKKLRKILREEDNHE